MAGSNTYGYITNMFSCAVTFSLQQFAQVQFMHLATGMYILIASSFLFCEEKPGFGIPETCPFRFRSSSGGVLEGPCRKAMRLSGALRIDSISSSTEK